MLTRALSRMLLAFCMFALAPFAVAQMTVPPRPIPIPDPYAETIPAGSGMEEIYIQKPRIKTVGSRPPLVLVFHGAYFNNLWEHSNDPSLNKNPQLEAFFDEVSGRNWYGVSMRGGDNEFNGTYAGPEMQARIDDVITYMETTFHTDPDRIYALGYSMGGVDALDYAARHVDPAGHRIAAAWSWSGALCARDTEKVLPGLWMLLGATGPYAMDPLPFIAASAVQTDHCQTGPMTCAPLPTFVTNESLAWNLEHMWITTTEATNDICGASCPAASIDALTQNWSVPAQHTHVMNYGMNHDDPSGFVPDDICDFFAGRTVTLPMSATRTIAVEETRYFHFDVTRYDQTMLPGVFGWTFGPQQLNVDKIENIEKLSLDVDDGLDSPLASGSSMTIQLISVDLQATTLVLKFFYWGEPDRVTLNGNVFTDPTPGVWDFTGTTLTLFGQAGQSTVTWIVDP